ncbi:heavy metal-associated isoprenylated plant protein 30 [Nymphaea colorata]|nr:heavy metal-associated isoprenylated plant protein 30 [Nymphaea colorata]
MKVPLYSYGCEKKIKKALARFKGIYSVSVEYNLQKVTVWGICDRDSVLAAVRKKRREARFWSEIETDPVPFVDVATVPMPERTPREKKLFLWKRNKIH